MVQGMIACWRVPENSPFFLYTTTHLLLPTLTYNKQVSSRHFVRTCIHHLSSVMKNLSIKVTFAVAAYCVVIAAAAHVLVVVTS